MESRDRSISRVRRLLERSGFYVIDTHNVRPTTFDLMARRDSTLVLAKVLKNIDALDPDEAWRLKELGRILGASVLIIGETSGGSELQAGVVYNRYGLPILVEESLRDYLVDGLPPFLFSSPGGVFARIDGTKLRGLRESRSLSLGALASVAGVSRRTIQLYEEGGGAEVVIVERIERYLQEPIARPIDLFGSRPREPARGTDSTPTEGAATAPERREDTVPESSEAPRSPIRTGNPLRDNVFRQLDGMGWEVVVTVRCPFDAFTHGDSRGEEEILLTSVGSLRSAQHRAEILQGLARVIEGHALFVVRDHADRTSIDGLPILTLRELIRNRDRSELVDLIAERESA